VGEGAVIALAVVGPAVVAAVRSAAEHDPVGLAIGGGA
jgi:hypothetical protein